MLPSLLQSKGIDPAYLMGIMNNGGGFGGFGGNGWNDIIALIVVAAIFGNGNFGFGNNGNNANSQLLTSLLERNGVDIASLASAVNCSSDRIRDAIGEVSTQICGLGNQLGQSTNQIITSLMQGNNALASQLASCCCSIEKGILESNYLTEKGFCNTNQILSQGFSSVAYAQKDQTCVLENAIKDSTAQILAGQAAIEKRELQREIATLQEEKQTYKLGNMIAAATNPIAAELESIKCRLPKTEVITATPEYVPVNRSINVAYAPYCGYGFGAGYGFPYGNFCNGVNNAF
jgi:hypothetical protein